MLKLGTNLPGIHDLSSLETLGKRSIPHSVKSAYLALFMAQQHKDRLLTERERLDKKQKQINGKLVLIKREIDHLKELVGKAEKNNPNPTGEKNKRTVISY